MNLPRHFKGALAAEDCVWGGETCEIHFGMPPPGAWVVPAKCHSLFQAFNHCSAGLSSESEVS